MTTNFPTSLDAYTRPTDSDSPTDGSAVDLTVVLDNMYDAIEALEAKTGIDSSAVATTLEYILKNTSSGHDHDGADSKTVPHANLASVTANQHHNQAHAISGADHTGTLTFSQTSGTFVRLTSDATLTTATIGNLSGLSVALSASATYVFDAFYIADGPTADDLKFDFTGTYTAIIWGFAQALDVGATAATGSTSSAVVTAASTTATVGAPAVGTKALIHIHGIARTSGSTTLQARAAKAADAGADATIFTDSHLIVTQVA